jgi:hypothetical protein
MKVFLRESAEIEHQRWKREAITMRLAANAEGDDFKKFLDGR